MHEKNTSKQHMHAKTHMHENKKDEQKHITKKKKKKNSENNK